MVKLPQLGCIQGLKLPFNFKHKKQLHKLIIKNIYCQISFPTHITKYNSNPFQGATSNGKNPLNKSVFKVNSELFIEPKP